MPFATLQWQLFCMPGSYGARHALSAWGDCDPKNFKYHMGPPEDQETKKVGSYPVDFYLKITKAIATVLTLSRNQESLQAISTQAGLHNKMSGHGWGFKVTLESLMALYKL
jgi:hypothetical protein